MQKLVNGEWVDCAQEDLVAGDIYRISIGGGWQQQAYQDPAPANDAIEILINDISGVLKHNAGFTRATVYELVTFNVSGTLEIPDQTFSLPIRRNDGRLFIFLANVISGAFSVDINFPTSGSFVYSVDECNIDLPYKMFNVETMRFDVLRAIPV